MLKKKRPFVGEGSNYSRGVDEGKKLPPAIGTEVDRQEQKQQHSEAEAERDDLSVGGGEGDKMLSPARKKARTEDKGEETDEEFSSPFGSYLCQSPAPRSSPRVIDEDDIISKLDEDPPTSSSTMSRNIFVNIWTFLRNHSVGITLVRLYLICFLNIRNM